MDILDIGAGMTYVNPRSTYHRMTKEQGGIQLPVYRWSLRNTSCQVRRVAGTDEWLYVDGVDLQAPGNFTDENKMLTFNGYDTFHMPRKEYPVITWLYPNPWDIITSERQRNCHNNPLDAVLTAVSKNLRAGGKLLIETDMEEQRPLYAYGSGLEQRDASQALVLLKSELSNALVITRENFVTDERARRRGYVYLKV
ncbi:MAG: hypothetical protein HY364_03640 [Candidatus Aenigmarchaeota archaeon]|nr:hypothetical protein [Candidatus Aenigmarchaeota archaeon]